MNHSEQNALSFERIVFFSDAVFAIVITLLVLEIKVPHIEEIADEEVRKGLFELLPKFLGFIFSFFIIGIMWVEHHRIFQFIKGYDMGLLWRNLIFLLCISFIPFPTALFSEYFWSKTAFILYSLIFALAALAKLWVWNYVVKNNLLDDNFDKSLASSITRRSLAVPIGCVLCLSLAMFLPNFFSFIGFPLIPLFAKLLVSNKKTAEEEKV
ncbi:MAG: DUF1211 domain-containing protein [Pyrinomonadaceae bacterium]|nr:DUF1211 domain-containing protein [Pyrinomonadaceae bacterium]